MSRLPHPFALRLNLVGLLGLLFGLGAPTAQAGLFGYNFPGASPEELALAAPKLDPEAPAEFLERRIRLNDREGRRTIDYYSRIKIFNEAGVEAFHAFELEPFGENRIRRVKAQVTFPDGATQESERDAIYTREVWKNGESRGSRTSIAIPGLRPGSIIELHYEEDARDNFHNLWVFAHVHFPTHLLRFEVRFHEYSRGGFTYSGFSEDAIEDYAGRTSFTLHDLPATNRETYAPPRTSYMPWILIYYLPEYLHGNLTDAFWEKVAKEVARWERKHTDADARAIRAKASTLTEGLETDDDRLRALYDFCTREIRNIHHDDARLSNREIEELRMPDNPEETLEYGHGNGGDRFTLFLSLAEASGFEARAAVCNNRASLLFNPNVTNLSATPDFLAAVRRNASEPWRFFDLYYAHLPFGTLHWSNCATKALLSNRKGEVEFVDTPKESAATNETQRFGIFKMDAEGNLTGTVRLIFKGQAGIHWRNLLDHETDSEREDTFRDYLGSIFSDFTLSDLKLQHLSDPEQPVQADFKFELPSYGMPAGSRLFLCPEVFEPEGSPLFESPTRVHDVQFPYPWQVVDKVIIEYPAEFTWDQDTPSGGIGEFEQLKHYLRYWHDPEKHRFTFQRLFSADVAGFGAPAYPVVKRIFDKINELDRFPLTLRVAAESSETE